MGRRAQILANTWRRRHGARTQNETSTGQMDKISKGKGLVNSTPDQAEYLSPGENKWLSGLDGDDSFSQGPKDPILSSWVG